MKKRIFGTDGVRGIAGVELGFLLSMNIGKAVASVICKNNKSKILIAKDTRLSSDSIEAAVAAGICSMGSDAILLGVLPTPAICFLVKELKADAAIMISASHNSFEYNGIKIFNKNGFKLDDKTEDEIEFFLREEILNKQESYGSEIGKILYKKDKEEKYINNLINIFNENNLNINNKNLKIAIDCANGASYKCAKKIFDKLGFEYKIINDTPNGININDNCGSTNLDSLCEFVTKNNFDIGIAFDGDGDRCICISKSGQMIDGDNIMAFCAINMLNENSLSKDCVVGTPMSNLGFINFLKSKNINFIETKVGDRYILEEIIKNNYNFGGEQSGHIIFKNYRTTGDGLLTAIMVIKYLIKNNINSSEKILKLFDKVPQILINIRLNKNENYNNKIEEITQELKTLVNGNDKFFIRESGTEPLLRIMVQSLDKVKLNKVRTFLLEFLKFAEKNKV